MGSTALCPLGRFFLVLVHDKVFTGVQGNEKTDVLGFSEIQMEKGEGYPFPLESLSFLTPGDKILSFMK